MIIFKTGEHISVTYEGRTVQAVVLLASGNGRSLMIEWGDGMLGGHLGRMPILANERGEFVSLMEGKPVTLRHVE